MSGKRKIQGHDNDKLMEDLLKNLVEEYGTYDDRTEEKHEPSLNALSRKFDINIIKVRKLLITAGAYSTEVSRKIAELKDGGMSVKEIGEKCGLSRASVNSYLPYDGIAYKMPKRSVDAERAMVYRRRKQSVESLQGNLTEDALWNVVVLFQEYVFFTVSGLPFSYTLKKGRKGTINKELVVNRRKESKTLAWSSVVLAFHKALDLRGEVVKRPKALGDIRGISYVYPMLFRFGIIEVPDKIAEKMRSGASSNL